MHIYFEFFGKHIPSYGLMIVLGVITANIIALHILRHFKLDWNDFIILEAYSFLGGFIGAKVLYLIVSYRSIEWKRILEPTYFNQLMRGGFVFYGGLIGGLLFVIIAGKVHKIEYIKHLTCFICLIPYIHSFGRIGCFLAGCCYGIPYTGVGAVVFPSNSLAPSDISLFPVQLVEAFCLMVIALVVYWGLIKRRWSFTVEIYLILYAIIRFILEYYRYDDARGHIAGLFTSQWISILLVIIGAILIAGKMSKNKAKLE